MCPGSPAKVLSPSLPKAGKRLLFLSANSINTDKEATQPTFQTVIDDRNAATYRNFGMGFVNTDFSYLDVEVTSAPFTGPEIYIDNWRVVPCKSVVISDYPEDEETAE